MSESLDALTLEFLTWIASCPRTYAEVMDAWRTSCPRHPVWEEAGIQGLVQIESGTPTRESRVSLTSRGREKLSLDSAAEARSP